MIATSAGTAVHTAVVNGSRLSQDLECPDIETASDGYAARFASPAGVWLLARQTAALRALLAQTTGGPLRTLDVGGGHGQVAPVLLECGHSVVVHGSAASCLLRLQPLRDAMPHRLGGVTSGLWNLPFADGAFDLVVAVRVLAHVERWRDLLAELARVSSRYVILEFARAGAAWLPGFARDAAFGLKRLVEGNTRPFFSYREADLTAELERLGFACVASAGQFLMPMALHRLLRMPRASAHLEDAFRALGAGDVVRSPALLLAERVRRG